jgi:hypothetical protein
MALKMLLFFQHFALQSRCLRQIERRGIEHNLDLLDLQP